METDDIEFTHDELIEALLNAQNDQEDSDIMTAPELDELVPSMSLRTIRNRLKSLVKEGKAEPARKRKYDYLGRPTTVIGVRLVKDGD